MIRGQQTAQKTTSQEKIWVKAGPGKEREKGRTEKRERNPTHPQQNRTEEHRTRTERIVATEKKGEEKKHSNAKDP